MKKQKRISENTLCQFFFLRIFRIIFIDIIFLGILNMIEAFISLTNYLLIKNKEINSTF
jgi:hypothetical protein